MDDVVDAVLDEELLDELGREVVRHTCTGGGGVEGGELARYNCTQRGGGYGDGRGGTARLHRRGEGEGERHGNW